MNIPEVQGYGALIRDVKWLEVGGRSVMREPPPVFAFRIEGASWHSVSDGDWWALLLHMP